MPVHSSVWTNSATSRRSRHGFCALYDSKFRAGEERLAERRLRGEDWRCTGKRTAGDASLPVPSAWPAWHVPRRVRMEPSANSRWRATRRNSWSSMLLRCGSVSGDTAMNELLLREMAKSERGDFSRENLADLPTGISRKDEKITVSSMRTSGLPRGFHTFLIAMTEWFLVKEVGTQMSGAPKGKSPLSAAAPKPTVKAVPKGPAQGCGSTQGCGPAEGGDRGGRLDFAKPPPAKGDYKSHVATLDAPHPLGAGQGAPQRSVPVLTALCILAACCPAKCCSTGWPACPGWYAPLPCLALSAEPDFIFGGMS